MGFVPLGSHTEDRARESGAAEHMMSLREFYTRRPLFYLAYPSSGQRMLYDAPSNKKFGNRG
jgi:hypothetical protein